MKRIWALGSILTFTAVILAYLWWGRFQYAHSTLLAGAYAVAATLVVVNHWRFRDSRRTLGLRVDNWRAATTWFGSLTLAGSLGIAGLGAVWGRFAVEPLQTYAVYALWAGIQQYLLQNFLRLRAADLLAGDRRSDHPLQPTGWRALATASIAAALFALLHAPSLPVVGLTFLAGLLWCRLYSQIPSFPWAWISHAVLGVLLLLFFKQGPLGEISVGQPGFRYDYYGQGVIPAGGVDGEGRAFVATLPGNDRGVEARVRVYDPQGDRTADWVAFPGLEFSGRLAVGDLGFGPGDEIAVTPGPGPDNPSQVAIYDRQGRALSRFQVEDFPQSYGAWVTIACGTLLLSPGPAPKAPPIVAQFDPQGRELARWEFPQLPLENGIEAAGVCRSGNGTEIPPGAGSAAGPDAPRLERLLLWGSSVSVNPSTVFIYNLESGQLETVDTLPTTFGANVCPLHLGGAGAGFAVAPGPLRGYPPWVKVFTLEPEPAVFRELVPFGGAEAYGSNLSAVDLDGDGTDELIFGEGTGPDRPSTIRICRLDGTLLHQWNAYD